MLTRTGYVIDSSVESKKELTVRPIVNTEFGLAPPSFKVFKETKQGRLCVPRFYGLEKFGEPRGDTRPDPAPGAIRFVGKLRDETHQNEAFTKAVSTGHGVISLPCGYGKTTVALAIAAHFKLRTMIIVHKEFLATQWRERIQQFCPGSTIGTVQQDRIETNCDFVVAMLQSLSLKEYTFEQFESVGTLIVDEAHHICARVFSQALFKVCPRHVFGLTATPERKDGLTKLLYWFLGPPLFSVERENQGQVHVHTLNYDCPAFHEGVPCNRLGKVSLVQMITDLVENPDRNEMLVRVIQGLSTRTVLVLSDRRAHCEELHARFPDTSGLYMGGMKARDLEATSKKKLIFGTFSQAHEGLDIPALDTVVLVTPKSDIKQSIGRIMRETGVKKNDPWIFDVCDNWSLLHAMYQKRKKVYKAGGFVMHGTGGEEPEKYEFIKGLKCLV